MRFRHIGTFEDLLASEDILDSICAAETRISIKNTSHSQIEESDWLKDYFVNDCLLALLLPKFTYLETLDLAHRPPEEGSQLRLSRVEIMLERAARKQRPFKTQPAFEKLHSFVWISDIADETAPVANAPFMFPSIRSVFWFDINPDAGLPIISNPRSSTCTHLELRDWLGSYQHIEEVLLIPKALKTFTCRGSNTTQESLDTQKESLEDVWLWVDWEEMPPCLQDFSKLRRLCFEICNVDYTAYPVTWLLDVLPPGLRALCIQSDCHKRPDCFYVALKHVMLHKDSAVPWLTELSLKPTLFWEKGADPSTYIISQAENEAIQLAESVGISLFIPYGWECEAVSQRWGWDEDIEWQPCDGYNQTRYPKTMLRIPNAEINFQVAPNTP
jgi:hypothetical protein